MNEPQKSCIFRCDKRKWKHLPKDKSLFYINHCFGLPIGNLTSQIFANYFLNDFDHFIINELKFQYYGRYVDDFYILSKDKNKLIQSISVIKKKLQEIGITLHPKKIYIQHISKGVKFVGGIIKPHRTYITNNTRSNIYHMLYNSYKYISSNNVNKMDIYEFVNSFNSYCGFLKHHNTFNIRTKLLTSKAIEPWYQFCYIDKSFLKLKIYKDYNIFNKGILKYNLHHHPRKYKVKYFDPPLIVR